MLPAARKSDIFKGSCAHGCDRCSHTIVGWSGSIKSSTNVFINGLPAVRVTDKGNHLTCCGPNVSTHVQGSSTVFINGLSAVREGDQLITCGGLHASVVVGSPNVFIGG